MSMAKSSRVRRVQRDAAAGARWNDRSIGGDGAREGVQNVDTSGCGCPDGHVVR